MSEYKADYFEKLDNKEVECTLCPHRCKISAGATGLCRVRENKDGVLYSKNYALVSSLGLDHVEKKPLYHFYPGSNILSIGTFGCNLSCSFCQNWRISQEEPELKFINPEEIVKLAREKNAVGIAYTYSEPSVWFEYVRDTAKIAKENNLKNVLVTNGFINREPLQELLPLIDAANVDLKSMNNKFYHKYCKGQKEPVIDNIKLMNGSIHVEITTLLITGLNDSREELRELFTLLQGINPEIPLHLSRYFPAYKMNKPPTPVKKIEEAYELAGEYLVYVYPGNVNIRGTANTYCPECKEELISRNGYYIESKIKEGKCPECGHKIYGEFK